MTDDTPDLLRLADDGSPLAVLDGPAADAPCQAAASAIPTLTDVGGARVVRVLAAERHSQHWYATVLLDDADGPRVALRSDLSLVADAGTVAAAIELLAPVIVDRGVIRRLN